MTPVEYTIALVFGSLGFVLSIVLIWLFVTACLRSFGGARDGIKLRRVGARLEQAEQLIEQGKWSEALRELERSILLDVGRSRESIRKVRDHHQNVLSRCLVIAEEVSVHPGNIAEVERLFTERAELQVLYSKALEAFHKLRDRREQAGKHMPTWSKGDYDTRSREILEELTLNRKKLQEELARFFSAIHSPRSNEIVYH